VLEERYFTIDSRNIKKKLDKD